ncbi:protein CMSS1 isoform X1 [Anolis carolinensis]|uniref:protein CMSS1 isoform X1 n=1 Tax=Anolis carolinensis TaxID=28377 RepID=UPI00046266A4|nr:PREDICTED: protein CMSS1 isoform X1 [Anolis carolinensis]|eukprot:XP_008106030.1 PREDICTED: protein CMSS1 isoform X1 [Anolis carolinensis]
MGDTLEEPWWEARRRGGGHSGPGRTPTDLSDGESLEEDADTSKATRKSEKPKLVPSKKRKEPAECVLTAEKEASKVKNETGVKPKRRRKKKISDILAKSSPKPGVPEDLQKLLNEHFGAKRSVIELEELKLSDACFLPANDLTHSFSSYLKAICPKWAKIRKNHTEKKSVVILIICSSALRCLELIRSMAAFKGEGKVMKLFAKHIKIQEQVKKLEQSVIHVGVGTPGRIKALVEQDGLSLKSLKYVILDWNWRDQKLRRLIDIPEIRKETIELLETRVIKLCREDSVKLGLF